MSTTIAEFLVSLGWSSDPHAEKRFTDAIEHATLKAKLLGDMVEAAAVKVAAAVSGIAESFDRLYWMSQQTGAAVESFRAIGYAASQTGSSVADATSALMGLGKLINENRSGGTYIAGKVGFNADLSYNLELGKKFAAMSRTQQEQFGHKANLSEAMINALRDPEKFEKFIEYAQRSIELTGTGGEAARSANDFMTQFRATWMELDNLAEGGLTRLLKGLTPILEDFETFLKKNEGAIAKRLDEIATALVKVIDDLEKWLKNVDWTKVDERFSKFAENAKSLSDSIGGLTTAFEIFFGIWATTKAISALSAIVTLAGSLTSLAAAATLLQIPFLGGDTKAPDPTEKQTEDAIKAGTAFRPGQAIKNWWGNHAPTWAGGNPGGSTSGKGGITSQGSAGYQKIYDAAKAAGDPFPEVTAAQWAMESGWGAKSSGKNNFFGQTKAGGGWADYDSPEAGLAAHMAQWNPKYGNAKTPEEAIQNLVRAGYTPDPGYAEGVLGIIGKMKAFGGDASGGKIVGGANLMSSGAFTRATGIVPAVGSDLVQVTTAGGQKFSVNRWSAPNFKAFVEDLERSGYKFNGAPQGYNPRSNLSSGRPSEHAYGNAIDINPGANPYTHGEMSSDMPADISERAAKYGLSWGGDWQSVKDPMHFEWRGVPLPNHKSKNLADKTLPASSGGKMRALNSDITPDYFHNVAPLGTGGAGGGDVSHINAPQQTTIHIDGTGDPTAVAHMVAANQSRVASDMARALQGATK